MNKKLLSDIDVNYNNIFRDKLDPMNPLPMVGETSTIAEIITLGIIYVDGNLRDLNFWRVVRNAEIKDNDCNDDFQYDSIAHELQKDLIKSGFTDKVKIALIGTDADFDSLIMRNFDAWESGYTPINWNWCQDYWIVNDRTKYLLLKQQEKSS